MAICTNKPVVSSDIASAVARVLISPLRLRKLIGLGPSGLLAMAKFLTAIVPRASKQLRIIEARAGSIPDNRLRQAALGSIRNKAYHVQGGCILASFLPRSKANHYIRLIAPLESIYDYLDTLCDRHPNVDSLAYPVLHQALFDALDPERPLQKYYSAGPDGDDGGYLNWLVTESRNALQNLPGFKNMKELLHKSAALYTDLQTFKHYPSTEREAACRAWYERNRSHFSEYTWWEFASACGSQLQVYILFFIALNGEVQEASLRKAYDAYFPALAAIHVLLDSFIDQLEDHEHNELSLINCYKDAATMLERMRTLKARCNERFAGLREPARNHFVLQVMSLFYLTHPKVFAQGLDGQSQALLVALT